MQRITGEEGIPQATLENKIEETIRQIRASLREEKIGWHKSRLEPTYKSN
jgi:hypothetical protein